MNSLLLLCESIFSFVSDIQSGNKVIEIGLRKEAMSVYEDFLHALASGDYHNNAIEDAKYALVSLIDECIMKSFSKTQTAWSTQSLQLKYFSSHTAGYDFFARLDHLLKQQPINKEVISVYLFCLQLGFEGKYALSDGEALKKIRSRCLTALEEAIETEMPSPAVVARRVPLWVMWLVAVIIVIIVLIAFTIAIDEQGVVIKSSLLTRVENLHDAQP